MPDYARACRPPDYAPNYAIMPSIMARALVLMYRERCESRAAAGGPSLAGALADGVRLAPRKKGPRKAIEAAREKRESE